MNLLYPFWDRQTSRIRAGYRVVLQLILFAACLSIPWAPEWPVSNEVIGTLAYIAVLWLTTRYLDRRSVGELGFHFTSRWWKDWLFGLTLGFGLVCLIFVTAWSAGWLAVRFEGRSVLTGVFAGLLIQVCVGIREEALMRGYFFKNLAEGVASVSRPAQGALIAWGVTSILFGVLHAGNPDASLISTANIMAAGCFIGLPYLLTGSLAIPIGLHIAWNFSLGSVFGFPVSGTSGSNSLLAVSQQGPVLWMGGRFGPEAGLLATFMFGIGSLGVVFWLQATGRKPGIAQSLRTSSRPAEKRQGNSPPAADS